MPIRIGRPLTGNGYRATHQKQQFLKDFQILKAAEQYALRFYLSNGQECKIQQLEEMDTRQTEILPSTALLLRASHLLNDVMESDDVVLESSPLELLANPVSIIEFRRVNRSYSSIFLPIIKEESRSNNQNIEQKEIVKALIREFQISESDPVSDSDLATSFKNLASTDLDQLAGSSDKDNAELLNENCEFNELMRPLAEHLFRTFDHSDAKNAKVTLVNRFSRSAIDNWKEGLEMASVDAGLSIEKRDSLNVYPYVAIKRLQTLENAIVIVSLTQVDRLFQDEQIPRDHRLPGISIAVCMENQLGSVSDDDLLALQDSFQNRLSSLSSKCMAHMRGGSIESSGGEAAKIARFWFGNGVTNLLKTEEEAGGLETESGFEFWSRFVEEILCAKIDGVSSVEVFPFDRAFIFCETGVELDSENKLVRVLALEAALQSTAAQDRFEYLTSVQRKDRPLEQFDVAQKIIISKELLSLRLCHDNLVEFTDANDMLVDTKQKEAHNNSINININGDPKEHSGADIGLAAIMGRLTEEPNKNVEDELRKRFEKQDGIMFDYRHGLDIAQGSPILNYLDHAYKQTLFSDFDASHNVMQQKKYVYISFEPTLCKENKRDESVEGGNSFYLSENERVTLVLLADDDQEKSSQELTAEREDLLLVISMIFQQKLRDRKREVELIDRRVQVINGFLDGFTHRIKNEVSSISDEAIDLIKQQEDGLKRALRFDQSSLEKYNSNADPQNVLANVWLAKPSLKKDTNQSEESYSLDDLEKKLVQRARQLCEKVGKTTIPIVKVMPSLMPGLSMRIPRTAVSECLDVLFKNAVEASLASGAPQPAKITLEAQARPVSDQSDDRWALEIIIENTTGPITPTVWQKLIAKTPTRQEKNNKKEKEMGHSSGVGVFAARHLLRNGLGKNSDINFQMSGPNLVQARMSIPVLLSVTHGASETASAKQPVFDDSKKAPLILYVEDDELNFTPSMQALRDNNNGADHSIAHVTDKYSALAHLEAKLPKLLISDLSFYERHSDSTPDPKNGYQMLQKFVAICQKSNSAPPVWIVTGDDREGVIGELEETGILGEIYKVAPVENFDEHLMSDGTISILDNSKDLSKKPKLLSEVSILLQDASTLQETSNIVNFNSKRTERSLYIKRVPLSNNFPKNLQNHLEGGLAGNLQQTLPLIVIAEPTKALPPEESLSRWFTSDKIPDYHDYDPDLKYPITSSTFHKSFFLHLKDSDGVADLEPDLRYWFIRHNVLISGHKPKYVAGLWADLINESKGPLSRLRHDVMNLRLKAIPSSFFDTINTRTRSIENLLKIDTTLEKELLSELKAGQADKVLKLLKKITKSRTKSTISDAQNDMISIETTLAELSRLHAANYVKLRTTLPSLIRSVSATRQLVFI